jgi:DNA-binding transcriptional LysR family regulator
MNFRTLDLNLLRVFDVVMVERNVTRAAEQLAMTQPAVSNALRRLRDAIGEELFVSGSAGVTPTPQATALWPTVRHALGALRELLAPQGFDPALDERQFGLVMADATAAVVVPLLVSALERQRSRVALRVEPLTTRDPRALLERGAVDAAIGFFPEVAQALAAETMLGEFLLQPLYDCDYVCVMRRDHPLVGSAPLTLDQFCDASHVRVSFAGRSQDFVDAALAKLGRSRRVVLVLNQFATAAQAVCGSDLIVVLPRRYVPVCGVTSELAVADLPLEMPVIEISLLWHRRHERDPAQRWLRDILKDVATTAVDKARGSTPTK